MALRAGQERPIRVLVADDSAFMRTAVMRMVESDAELQVVGTANDGREALEKIAALDPDVVTLDIEMPRMNGLEALRQVMATAPRPVIIISSLTQEGAEATLEAFDLGAFDCIPKQLSYASLDIIKIRDQLVAKIKAAAASPRRKASARSLAAAAPVRPSPTRPGWMIPPSLVVLGTSTGGPKALQQILPRLPGNFPLGTVVVQHMPPGFTGPFAGRLNALCKVTVKEASHEDEIEPGVVLIAPAGWQLTIYRRTASRLAVRLAKTPADTLHIPSVDVMMLSAGELLGNRTMGVILTGMGADGALGMKLIHEKGGYTVGQDEASCAVYGMPRTCAEMGVLRRVVPLDEIPAEMVHAAGVKLSA